MLCFSIRCIFANTNTQNEVMKVLKFFLLCFILLLILCLALVTFGSVFIFWDNFDKLGEAIIKKEKESL